MIEIIAVKQKSKTLFKVNGFHVLSLKSRPSSWLGQRLTTSVTCSAFLYMGMARITLPFGGFEASLIWIGQVLAIWQYSFLSNGEYCGEKKQKSNSCLWLWICCTWEFKKPQERETDVDVSFFTASNQIRLDLQAYEDNLTMGWDFSSLNSLTHMLTHSAHVRACRKL